MTEEKPNHVINPETGFIENPAYAYDFDSERKLQFLRTFEVNNLRLYRTLQQLGISPETYNKHYNTDAAFKAAVDHVRRVYTDELEGTSRENALNPKSVIERIFQLKALLPGKYGDLKGGTQAIINLVIDNKVLDAVSGRKPVLDVQEIPPDSTEIAHMPQSTDDSTLANIASTTPSDSTKPPHQPSPDGTNGL